ncbi:MAG: hypothetical protein U0X87_18025 [Anaerolineales bacterium]
MTTNEDNLRIIEQSVAYLKANGKRVIYDAEHFFDGYKLDSMYAPGDVERITAARRRSCWLRYERRHNALVRSIVSVVKKTVLHPFGIHTHNDSECAVINSLIAIRAGAIQAQGTINGVGGDVAVTPISFPSWQTLN